MTDTYAFAPTALTGELVLELRTRHKLSRAQFSERAGFTGRSTARLSNIENKNSWKPGDREAVARVLNELEGGRFDPRYHAPRPQSPPNAVTVIVVGDEPPDDVDDVVDVVDVLNVASPIQVDAPLDVAQPVEPSIVIDLDDDDAYPISNSLLQSWKRCRRKWWLGWYRRLTLRHENLTSVRSTGDRVHRALQRWYVPEGEVRVDPRDALERVIVEDWARVAELAQERGLTEDRFNALAREFALSTNLERAMVEGYVQWLAETGVDAELRVIAPETALTADLKVDVGGETRTVRAVGRLDVRVTRVTDDVHLFIDNKTVGDLSSPTVTLHLDEQMMHYHVLEWLNSTEGERRCDGALYNMLRRVQRTARAKPPFYGRVEVHHNVYELESYKRRMLAATRDILTTIDALERGADHRDVAYPSPRPQCAWDCDFLPVCNMLDDGSPGVEDMLRTLYREHDPYDRYRGEEAPR